MIQHRNKKKIKYSPIYSSDGKISVIFHAYNKQETCAAPVEYTGRKPKGIDG